MYVHTGCTYRWDERKENTRTIYSVSITMNLDATEGLAIAALGDSFQERYRFLTEGEEIMLEHTDEALPVDEVEQRNLAAPLAGSLSRKKFVGLVGGAAAAAYLTGTVPAYGRLGRRATSSATLTLAVYQEPDSLDPGTMALLTSYQVTQSMFDPLMWQFPGIAPGKYFPGLATRYTVSPDASSYTFYLRKGVTFHDGTPFNAAAVKANFDYIVNPSTKSTNAIGQLGPYKSSRVIDDYTVEINFTQPNAAFVNEMTSQLFGISSPTAIAKYGADYSHNPVGTGPFMFKSWVAGEQVSVIQNPNYKWGPSVLGSSGPAKLAGVVYRILPNSSSQFDALQTGEVTLAQSLTPQNITSMLASGKYQQFKVNGEGLPYVVPINTQKFPTNDLQVRQALNFAANQQDILKSLFAGLYEPAVSIFDPPTPGFDAATQHLYSYNPTKAGQLLDAAGWTMGSGGVRTKGGQELSLTMLNQAASGWDGIATLLQSQFAAVGMKVSLSDQAWPAVATSYEKGVQNLGNDWDWDVDPYFVRNVFGPQFIKTGYNFSHYDNPALIPMISRANAIPNNQARAAAWAKIGAMLMQDAVVIPIYDKRAIFVGPTSIKNFAFTSSAVPVFNNTTV